MSALAGISVALKVRYGGHGNLPTKWEISFENLHECNEQLKAATLKMITGLPELPGIFVLPSCGFIALPQAIEKSLAGEVVSSYAEGDEEALRKALTVASHVWEDSLEVVKTHQRKDGYLSTLCHEAKEELRIHVGRRGSYVVCWRQTPEGWEPQHGVEGVERGWAGKILSPEELKESIYPEMGRVVESNKAPTSLPIQDRLHVFAGRCYVVRWTKLEGAPDWTFISSRYLGEPNFPIEDPDGWDRSLPIAL